MYLMRRLCISLAALLLMEQAGLCGLLCALPGAGLAQAASAPLQSAAVDSAAGNMPCHGDHGSPVGSQPTGTATNGDTTPATTGHDDSACCEQPTVLAAGPSSLQEATAVSPATVTVALLASMQVVAATPAIRAATATGPPGKIKRRPLYILNASFLA